MTRQQQPDPATIVFSGKGGVGKTTASAATAVKLSKSGLKTLIVSSDPAHSLSDCFDCSIGGAPVEISPNLWALELDALAEMRTRFNTIREVLVRQMENRGVTELFAEEMVAFPGAEELFALIRISKLKASNAYDAFVIDTAPTGNTIRFLNFPSFLAPVEQALKVDRLFRSITRPIASLVGERENQIKDEFYASISSLFREVEDAREFLENSRVLFRLVLTPEKLAVLETQRAVSFLNISGLKVDSLILNKLMPSEVGDRYFAIWKELQDEYQRQTREYFHPLTVLESPLFRREIIGLEMLNDFSEVLYGDRRPDCALTEASLFEIRKDGDGYVYECQVPYNNRCDVKLFKRGSGLVAKIGQHERNLQLPTRLIDREVRKAEYNGNRLVVRFA